MSNNRLAKLMGDIARERTRLRPVPRRGVGRFIADEDQVADEPAMISVIMASATNGHTARELAITIEMEPVIE